MTVLHAFFLGAVQGLTEFIPVSSTGHLLIVEDLFGIQFNPADLQGLNIMLHAGTLVALLLLYFETWKKILLSPFTGDRKTFQLLIAIIVATIPAAIMGFLFEEQIAELFQGSTALAICFLLNAIVLLFAESCSPDRKDSHWNILRFLHTKDRVNLNILSAFLIGVAQMGALIAAISRSGLTISAGQLLGLSRREALDFSFLILTPVLAGATLLTLFQVQSSEVLLPTLPIILTGVVTSFAFSALAIIFLRQFVARYSLAWFAPYLIGVAFFILL